MYPEFIKIYKIYKNIFFYKKDKTTIRKQITPEQNKAVLFNGLIYHASSKPIKNMYRLVLNINIKNYLMKIATLNYLD